MEIKHVNNNNEEILRDLPKLYDKIDQCRSSIDDYDRNIKLEENSIAELKFYVIQEEDRAKNKKRKMYDIDALKENMERCTRNIELFKSKKGEEAKKITRFKGIIEVLKKDLETPNEIIVTLESADKAKPDFRNLD